MLYLANPSTPQIRDAMRAGLLGMMDTPAQGNARPEGVPWAADNGCFSDRWDEGTWWSWLSAQPTDGCLFAAAPDVVGDWDATYDLMGWLPIIREAGFKAAIVLQDGITGPADVPWPAVDAVFTGGSTQFKLSLAARSIVQEAKALGKWTHMGRVNSLRRLRLAARDGYDSVDGTYLTFGPDVNLPKLLRMTRAARSQMDMGLGQ